MRQKTTRRLEKLEARAGINDEELTIIITVVDSDANGRRFISGGIRIIPGQLNEELPASYFNEEDNNEV